MIPTIFFLVIGILIIALYAYYFLIGDRLVPFSDMLACIAGLFLSIFSAVNVAAGNVGESMYVMTSITEDNVTTQLPELVSLPVIDAGVSWLFVISAIMFLVLLAVSISNMLREKKWRDSL